MQPQNNKEIARAARDGEGIGAAMRRAVANTVDERRKLGLPIVTEDSIRKKGRGGADNGTPSKKAG